MNYIIEFFNQVSGLGKYLMVPLMVAIIGLAFRCKPNKAIKGGITVGIGLMGLDLALSLVTTYLGPVATALVDKANLDLNVVDVGWPALAGIAYGTQIGAMIIPFMLLVNIILLTIGATKTMNIDIWNFWHYALTGSLIYFLSGSLVLGFLAATTHAVVIYTFADRTAEMVQETIGIPGISIPHGGIFGGWIVGFVMEPIYNFFTKKIKKTNKEVNEEKVNKLDKNPIVQIIKDPIYVGFILGVILAFIAGQDVKTSFTTGMAMSALMYLTPRMIQILMEGLVPIADACKKIISKRYEGEELYIGMDNAILLGHPTVMLATVVMIPICIILAMILPGNHIIPIASLAAVGYNSTAINVVHKGKPLRTFVSCTILLTISMLIGSAMAPAITKVALTTGFESEYANISAISGTLTATYPLWLSFKLSNIVGSIICLVIIVGCSALNIMYFRKKREMHTTEFMGTDESSYMEK